MAAQLRDLHTVATRQAVLASARERFGRRGFAGTSVDDIAADAGVTKGALYHHFDSKERLFEAVYDVVEGELTAVGIAAAQGAADPVESLLRAFGAFLDRALDADVRQVAVIDAPAVLGSRKDGIDARHSLGATQLAVGAAIEAGLIEALDQETLARMLLGVCTQAALLVATASDPAKARRDADAVLERIIRGLAPAAADDRQRSRRLRTPRGSGIAT